MKKEVKYQKMDLIALINVFDALIDFIESIPNTYPKICVLKSKAHGRGIFAKEDIAKGEEIESSPVIVYSGLDVGSTSRTIIAQYCFEWGSKGKDRAIALGLGSLFNHSYKPNARYFQNPRNKTINFFATRNIKKGEEIFVNYNGNPRSQRKVWFDKATK